MNAERAPDTRPGQAIYNRFTLRAYDAFVLGLTNRWIWGCPTERLVRHFREFSSANHLDVGVGSGYFPAHGGFDAGDRLVLMDLNPRALAHAARRNARLAPITVVADVMQPIEYHGFVFDSISLFYLLHCLPGALTDKAACLDHLAALLAPGGALFGATVLADAACRNSAAAMLMRLYNRRGIFSNEADDEHVLRDLLTRRFDQCRIERVGGVALFSARGRPALRPDRRPA